MKIYTNTDIIEQDLKPFCFVCLKEVDKFNCMWEVKFNRFFFRAECHGEIQEMDMDKFTMKDNKMYKGVAFVPNDTMKIRHSAVE